MALATATITYDLANLTGVPHHKGTRVSATTNIPDNTIADTAGNKVRVGEGVGTINPDGTGEIVVWVPGAGSNPASWQTYIHVKHRNIQGPSPTKTYGPFTITGDADLADLITEQAIPPDYLSQVSGALQGYVDSATTASTSAAASAQSAAASADIAYALVVSDLSTSDSQMKVLVEAPASLTGTAVRDTIYTKTGGFTRPTAGSGLVASLDVGRGDTVLHIAGDSTGNNDFEWVRKTADHIAARYSPDLRTQYRLWDDVTQTYPTTTVLQAGTVSSVEGGPATLLRDTFAGTRADLYGSTPDVTGPVWGGPPNAVGDWTCTNNGFVTRTSDATTSQIIATLERGDITATLTGIVMSTVGDTVNRTFNVMVKYIDSSNYLWLRIQVTATTGVVTWNLFKTVAGANTSLATGPATPLATNTASVAFDLAVSVAGSTFSATITPTSPGGSAATVTATLAGGDVTTFAAGDSFAFSSSAGTLVGMKISDVKVDVNRTAIPGYSVTVVNGSMPGATLAYHQARLAAMYPQAADALIISMGHNYNAGTPEDFITALDTFVAAYLALHPGTPIIVSSQNPEFTDGTVARPEGYVRAHTLRVPALRQHAAENGWGYLPVFEAFMSQADPRAFVHADGIHLNYDPTGVLDGSDLWAARADAYFDAMSYRTDI